MEQIKLNETPVRTSKNYNINNIKLDNVIIPEKITNFNKENVEILGNTSNIEVKNVTTNCDLTYGLGELFTKQVNQNANQKINLKIDENDRKELEVSFKLDDENLILIDNIEILANENSKSTIILKYESNADIEAYHNGILRVNAKQGAELNVILVNLINNNSSNFMSIENIVETDAKVNYTVIDFGGKNSITNYYTNLISNFAENEINTMYLGTENRLLDLNYIVELRGEKSRTNIEVQGALRDNAKKHFKGTIDFKKGCKKAKGNENESCMLLSETAKSLALPMLLCSEEDVEGNHSTSAGKVGENELFYIMSRGFDKKEAMKLMVKAKFNKILEKIEKEELRNRIVYEIDQILS